MGLALSVPAHSGPEPKLRGLRLGLLASPARDGGPWKVVRREGRTGAPTWVVGGPPRLSQPAASEWVASLQEGGERGLAQSGPEATGRGPPLLGEGSDMG
eukprot:CAMPEP_0183294420 /NCGR_PEP_ID=MMETSP0160_2-20130417/2771_1 /TAXON_ID=2839 ORGANISM="Odontella Sinensis, Strain Grunow 1884" /NCGR_SAMPLE_ID=MMETSP0160_2 /ASSEMBLY_ACC=CAM_ASM_000250 /LENGTH=99 /DNA_ID=CAMNT_0025455745 /DNA_START=357 /DNA_END=652 /DNA_ORIENTATION=-